uniref:Uncharacterized protein n=1 Tax=Peronospora matthiolae TaxID=2874970 RepID=A0AAV1TSW0_9STRA
MDGGFSDQTTAEKGLDEEAEQQQQQQLQTCGTKAATGRQKKDQVDPKVAARVNRRRKRTSGAVGSTRTGISQTSAVMLFRCSSQLLRQQALDYDVRAREMEERNAVQTKEIREWEKRVQSLKRELALDGHEEEGSFIEDSSCAVADNRLESLASAAAAFSGHDAVESLLPSGVVAAETSLQNELRRRVQKMQDFCNSVPGFIHAPDEPKSRHY